MFLKQTRIRNIDNVLSQFGEEDEILIILNNAENYTNILKQIGFNTINVGDSVLPKAVGSVSRYNADGKYNILRDLPKESYTIDRDITFSPYGIHTPITKTVTYNYQRYQRELIEAPTQELFIMNDKDNKKIICSNLIKNIEENKILIKHIINLFLEIFKECFVVDKNLLSRVRTPIKKLNWNILPRGKMDQNKLKEYLDNKKVNLNKNSKEIYARINYINSFEPNFMAVGNGGFNEYIVLGFEDRNIYVLENIKPQNATYIFENNWEELTQLTKGDILRERKHKFRLIHTDRWKENLKDKLI